MFNWFNKKEEAQIVPELFKDGKVQYLPFKIRGKLSARLFAFAKYHGLKIKQTTGLFVSNYGGEVIAEPVMRVELLEKVKVEKTPDVKVKKKVEKKVKKKREYPYGSKKPEILKLLKKKVPMADICRQLKTNPTYVWRIKNGRK